MRKSTKRKRTIAVVTGSRAEYGLLAPVVEALEAERNLDAGLVVTGVHLDRDYGETAGDIEKDGFRVWARVPMYRKLGTGFDALPGALARAIEGIDLAFAERRPDIVVVLGDRLEAMAAALAAFYRRIVLAHVHGGEITDLHIDDSTRHAISRLAHIHFPATTQSAARLRRMGEEGCRIHRCGAPGLDAIRALPRESRADVVRSFGFSGDRPFALFLFHPETTAWRDAGAQADRVLRALRAAGAQILALYPNGDPGSDGIIATLRAHEGPVRVERHLPRERFLQALGTADVLAGNSSSGLIEASFTRTPVLHTGERNRGREHGGNALFVEIEPAALARGLARVLGRAFKAKARRAPCPWGDGRTGPRIARVLASIDLDPRLLAKRLVDPLGMRRPR